LLKSRRLEHREEAEKFYRDLGVQGTVVRVGMEASGHARWFERLLGELGFELWIGDAAEIRAKRVRKQKTDRQDAELILRLLLEDRFPQVWVPSWENRDLRQLLWHRHRMVQARTRIMNQLQAVALNEGLRCKKRLWRDAGRQQLESFQLAPWASRRRRDLLELLDRLTPMIAELTAAIEQEVEKCPAAQLCYAKTSHPREIESNTKQGLQILFCEISPVAVGLQPIIKMDLVQVGSDDLFSHLVSFRAQEGNAPPGKGRNQGLHDPIGIDGRERIPGFDRAEGRCDYQELVRTSTHLLEALYERRALNGERVHQVAKILAFHHADIFQAGNGIIPDS
jgi:Transposase